MLAKLIIFSLKVPSEQSPEGLTDTDTEILESDDRDYILCSNCSHILTSPSERIEINSAHKHVFANPHGIVFQIACFSDMRNHTCAGPITTEWSWFPNFAWQTILCPMCLIHIGWRYLAHGSRSFFGLITERLIEP